MRIGWGVPGSDCTFSQAQCFVRYDFVGVDSDRFAKAFALSASAQGVIEIEETGFRRGILDVAWNTSQHRRERQSLKGFSIDRYCARFAFQKDDPDGIIVQRRLIHAHAEGL